MVKHRKNTKTTIRLIEIYINIRPIFDGRTKYFGHGVKPVNYEVLDRERNKKTEKWRPEQTQEICFRLALLRIYLIYT